MVQGGQEGSPSLSSPALPFLPRPLHSLSLSCPPIHSVPLPVLSGTCYSASYMSQTRDQKRFTISEVAADWQELMIPQRTMRPSIARVSEQLDLRFAASSGAQPRLTVEILNDRRLHAALAERKHLARCDRMVSILSQRRHYIDVIHIGESTLTTVIVILVKFYLL